MDPGVLPGRGGDEMARGPGGRRRQLQTDLRLGKAGRQTTIQRRSARHRVRVDRRMSCARTQSVERRRKARRVHREQRRRSTHGAPDPEADRPHGDPRAPVLGSWRGDPRSVRWLRHDRSRRDPTRPPVCRMGDEFGIRRDRPKAIGRSAGAARARWASGERTHSLTSVRSV